MSKEIADLEAIEALVGECEAIEKKIESAQQEFVKAYCPYKVGGVMTNDLEWCFSRLGKQIRIRNIYLRPKRGVVDKVVRYSWRIHAVVLKKGGAESSHTVSGTKPLTFKNRSM